MQNILLIDDCAEMRETVGDMLEDAGYKVFKAESSEQADRLCESNTFSLILCDLVLPVGEGDELPGPMDSAMVGVHTLHKLSKRFPHVPIVAISGQLIGDPLQTMSQFGARAVLSKPFGRDELLKTVDEVMARAA